MRLVEDDDASVVLEKARDRAHVMRERGDGGHHDIVAGIGDGAGRSKVAADESHSEAIARVGEDGRTPNERVGGLLEELLTVCDPKNLRAVA